MGKQLYLLARPFALLLVTAALFMGCTAMPLATPTRDAATATVTLPATMETANEATATSTSSVQAVSPTSLPATATTIPTTATPVPTAATTPGIPMEGTATPTIPSAGTPVVVAFVKDGTIRLWHEDTNQSETIFDEGGAESITISDDGQIIAFIRRWLDFNHCQQIALWAVDRDGENAREIVSPAELRDTLGAAECQVPAILFARIEWLPHTHRLVYSVIADAPHAPPQGLYLADADALSTTMLVSTDHSLRFVPSPDGRQIALMSTTGLSFINADGSNWHQDVLTYPKVGIPIPLLPNGVWTLDGRAFLIVAPIESESESGLNFTIMRVPVDGSAAQSLATIADTNGDSVTFSPDGQHASFSHYLESWAWYVTPLAADIGPLDIPYALDLGAYANLHWSPAATAFVFPDTRGGTLFQLCPDATQATEVCGEPVNLDSRTIAFIQWIDNGRFLFVTRDPYTLFLGRLDGTTIPIVTWSPDESQSFSTPLQGCWHDSEFVLDVNTPDGTHFSPGASFNKTWRLRNSGACTWDASYRLNFISGEQMNGPQSIVIAESVPPGGEIDLSINLTAPQAGGTYRGQWQLAALDGTLFGIKPYVEIVVQEGEG